MAEPSCQQHADDQTPLSVAKNNPFSMSHCLSYSAPYVIVMWLTSPINILQGIYAKYYSLSLTTLATIVLFGRLFDAITDPLIGYYSDHYSRRSGTRKPFILTGGLLLISSSYFLYMPVDLDTLKGLASNSAEIPTEITAVYVMSWFMVLYLGMTLFDIPHSAWASELALTSTNKSKIYTFRSVAAYSGLILFYAVPLLPFFESHEITPFTLAVSFIAASILMLPCLYICFKNTPNSTTKVPVDKTYKPASEGSHQQKNYFRYSCRSILRNKPLLFFLGAYLIYGLSAGMWHGLIFLYVDSYLGLGEQFAQMFLFGIVFGIIAAPAWYKLAVKFGKKTALALAMTFVIISFIYTGILKPGETSLQELILLIILSTLGSASMVAIVPAMLSEIVDYSIWKFRIENTGTYFSLFTLTSKANVAIGASLGLAIAGRYGFDATTTTQSLESIAGLMLAMVWLPIIFAIIALVLIVLNPINAHRHWIIRCRLDALALRASDRLR